MSESSDVQSDRPASPVDVEARLAELQDRVAALEAGRQNKLSMVVFSGELDKLIAAMIIATTAAALGMRVVQFFTFWGIAALREPKARVSGKDFMSKMFGWMLPTGRNKVKLSRMNMGGMGAAMMKSLMKKKKAADLDQLFEMAGQFGVEINVCTMSMDLMGFQREEIIDYPHLEYVGAATFLANAAESSIQLFI